MNALVLIFTVLVSSVPDSTDTPFLPENWELDCSCLVEASAVGSWRSGHPVMDTTGIDAALSVSASSPEVDFMATAAVQSDSSTVTVFRRGRAAVKWPGTPWIGGGGYYRDVQPFIPGLRDPVAEWGWTEVDSLMGLGVSGGGILGFSGEYFIQMTGVDTLTQLNVSSPWLGFVGLDYSRVRLSPGDSTSTGAMLVNVLAVRSDFRYAEPWLVIAGGDGESGNWAFSGELRDIRPFSTGMGRIEIVPGVHFAGDSIDYPGGAFVPGQRVLSLACYLRSARYMVSAGLEGMLDLESDSLTGISAMAGMVSERGLRWDLSLDVMENGDYRGIIASSTSDDFASAGMQLEIHDDSTRVTGIASYSPRSDVCAEMRVSGDLDDSLQPSCDLILSTALGPVRGILSVNWTCNQQPELRMNLRGLFR